METKRVDRSALKVNQAFIILLLITAFVLNTWALVALVAAVMFIGTAIPSLSLFKRIYRHLLAPAGLVRPDMVPDNPQPHRFAQGFGGIVVCIGYLALIAGAPVWGWALVWLVVALAALNLFLGFCAGCFLYYQLNRLGVPGFDRRPLT